MKKLLNCKVGGNISMSFNVLYIWEERRPKKENESGQTGIKIDTGLQTGTTGSKCVYIY